jgi:hypothetical protein
MPLLALPAAILQAFDTAVEKTSMLSSIQISYEDICCNQQKQISFRGVRSLSGTSRSHGTKEFKILHPEVDSLLFNSCTANVAQNTSILGNKLKWKNAVIWVVMPWGFDGGHQCFSLQMKAICYTEPMGTALKTKDNHGGDLQRRKELKSQTVGES